MPASSEVIIEIDTGALRGRTVPGSPGVLVREFLGVPYAAPPIGPLRFRPPQPPARWSGVRDALAFAPAPPQAEEAWSQIPLPRDHPMDEDCLALNIWAPARTEAPAPVMVWFHGGGYRVGGSMYPSTYGAHLAAAGVVVVSVGYRLGALGFAAHPDLTDESGACGNWGLLDQRSAMAWVQQHIAAFGGDPDRVTIMGESAGGSAVALHLCASTGHGLFHRAILQSAAPKVDDTARAAEQVERLVAELDLPDVRSLRDVPAERLLAAQVTLEGPGSLMVFYPTIDGAFFDGEPFEMLARRACDVPVLWGTNLDEWRQQAAADRHLATFGPEALDRRLERHFGTGWVELRDVYARARESRGAPSTPADLWVAIFGDAYFRLVTHRLAAALSAAGATTYAYLLTWESADPALGACHMLDIPFVFGTHADPEIASFTGTGPGADTLATTMMGAWVAMAATGNPSTDRLGPWPPYDEERRATMLLGPRCQVVDAPFEAERDVLERVVPAGSAGVRLRPAGAR